MDPIAQNVAGVANLVQSRTNKINSGASFGEEGITDEKIDALSLEMDDEELLRLRDTYVAKYATYESKIKPKQERNKGYYLGQQMKGSPQAVDDIPIAGNLIFEAEETFLPAALAKNPEPVCYADNSPEGNKVSGDIKTLLQYHADTLVLRRKLARMTRQWSIYYLGVIKHGWDSEINDIKSEIRKIQDFIFDPDGTVDEYGDFNSWLGERITISAEKLIEMFPKHKAYITVMVDGKLGTEVTYTEFWTDKFTFTTFKDKVLDKAKNQFFNYSSSEPDEFGELVTIPARNHFARPKKPYTFLSVFSLGEQPHDITGLIEQNIPNQNLVAKRIIQIDTNLSKANNSDVFSEDNFTQQTAKQAANAMIKGNPILAPKGRPIGEAIARLSAPTLGEAFFKDLDNNKQSLLSSFGTEGLSSQPPQPNTTARGMILNQQFDNSRIGGGIGDAIEQVADNIFNWWVQLYYVFYDEKHFAAVLGKIKAVEYVELSNADLNRQLIVSVAPDSMKPKDEITEMNQALTLWDKKAIDPKTLLTILNFPDPQQTAAQAVLWNTNPQLYLQLNFPDMAQLIARTMMPAAPASPALPEGGTGGGGELAPVPPPTLSEVPASASLSQVPLPQ